MLKLAVVSHKGGAGKTAVAVNLAGALVESGHTALCVDVDPTGGLGAALGIPSGGKPRLYEVLTGQAEPLAAIVEREGVLILPADLDLAGAEVELPRRSGWRTILADALATVDAGPMTVDVAILDTPPGLGVLSFAAVSAASTVIAVCPPEFMAFRALPDVLDMAGQAGVDVLGIVPTFAHRTTRHAREVAEALEADYGTLLLPAIPRRVAVQDAALAGRPVPTYAHTSDVADAFRALAQEVLTRVGTPQPA